MFLSVVIRGDRSFSVRRHGSKASAAEFCKEFNSYRLPDRAHAAYCRTPQPNSRATRAAADRSRSA
jgi:hypothetical protein